MRACIFGRCGLQVRCLVEQLVKNGENTILFVELTQAGQETQQKFRIPPLSCVDGLLQSLRRTSQNILCNLLLLRIREEDDARSEGNLEGLLNDQLKRDGSEGLLHVLVVVIVGSELGEVDSHVLRQAAWILRNLEQATSNARAGRRLLSLPRIAGVLVKVIVVCGSDQSAEW